MEAPSKRVVGVAVAVGLIALVGTFLWVGGDDGDPGAIGSPGSAFEDADQRFSGSSEDPTTRTHAYTVPSGTSVMTVAASIAFEEDGRLRLLDEDGDQRGIIDPELGTGMDLATGLFVVHRPDPGSWTHEIACGGPCEYSVANYLADVVSAPAGGLREDVAEHEVVVHSLHERSVSSQETFEVPEGTQALEFAASFYAADGGSFTIQDPSGEQVKSANWGAEWLVRGLAETIVERPQAGTWTIEFDCQDGCQGAWGFSFVRPEGS